MMWKKIFSQVDEKKRWEKMAMAESRKNVRQEKIFRAGARPKNDTLVQIFI